MLTRRELSLLRLALVYWSEENLSHSLPTDERFETLRTQLLDTQPSVINDLFQRLDESRVRYVVVDTIEQQVVNKQLFVHPPSVGPAYGRWQAFSVIA